MTRAFVRLNEQLLRFLLLASFMMAVASVTTPPAAAELVDVHDQLTYAYDDSANLPPSVTDSAGEPAVSVALARASDSGDLYDSPQYTNATNSGAWRAANESMSSRAAAYQTQITGRSGAVFEFGGVKFDGFADGVLLEAKGPGYSSFVSNCRRRLNTEH